MKKIFIISFVVLFFTSFAFAGVMTHGGFGFTVQHKTDTGVNTTETDTVLWTPSSGSKIVLMGYQFVSNVATTLLIESGSTAIIPTTQCTASGIVVLNSSVPIWEGTADATLTYTVGSSGVHSILLWGYEK